MSTNRTSVSLLDSDIAANDGKWVRLSSGAFVLATPSASDVAAIATSALDTDGTLAANSDTNVASQKATKTYVDTHAADTTSVHGIADTASVVLTSDSRLRASQDALSHTGVSPLPTMWLASNTAALTSQALDGMYGYVRDTTTRSTLWCLVTAQAAATPTISRLGVWTATPSTGALTALAASTTNDTALLTSTGARSKAISGGTQVSGGIWTPVADQFYFFGVLCVTSAGLPTLVSGPGSLAGAFYDLGGSGTNPMTGRLTGQSDLPSTGSPSLAQTRTALVVGT